MPSVQATLGLNIEAKQYTGLPRMMLGAIESCRMGAHNIDIWQVFVKIVSFSFLAVGHNVLMAPLLQELPEPKFILNTACKAASVTVVSLVIHEQ